MEELPGRSSVREATVAHIYRVDLGALCLVAGVCSAAVEDRSDRSSVRDATFAQIRFRVRAENCEQGGLLRRKSEVRAFKLPL